MRANTFSSIASICMLLGFVADGSADSKLTRALLSGSRLGFEALADRGRPQGFVARGSLYSVLVSAGGAQFAWLSSNDKSAGFRMDLVGPDLGAAPVTQGKLPEQRNLILSNDPARWRTNVEVYSRVTYRNIYPGIDISYYGAYGGRLEYDFRISPGSDPARIRIRFTGAESIRLSPAGGLLIRVGERTVELREPTTYQEIRGLRRRVDVRYRLIGDKEVTFAIAGYDRSSALIIDPVLSFSTFLGGSAFDAAYGVALDASGNIYVTGETYSTNFAASGNSQSSTRSSKVIFVVKLNPTGAGVLYSTFLGGTQSDSGHAIAVDSSGNAYVTGVTASKDFPMTSGAFDGRFKGSQNAFVLKLNSTGFLDYSSYLGGGGSDFGAAIAVDTAGEAYVAGYTSSANFPTTAGAYMTAYHGGAYDAFIAKVNAQGTAIVYSTYLGGGGNDTVAALAVDSAGDVYVAGQTSSSDFPLDNAFQATLSGTSDAFIAKLNPSGSALVYSSYFGGTAPDGAVAIALDAAANAYITGWTQSWDFPVSAQAFQPAIKGSTDAFVVKVNPAGTQLTYATYLGGTGIQQGSAVGVDGAGNAWVAGFTGALDFPMQNALQASNRGLNDAFLSILDPTGSTLVFSTCLGGSGDDRANGMAIDGLGHAVLTGFTTSSDFPATNSSQLAYAGNYDAFVAKIQGTSAPAVAVSMSPAAATLSPAGTQQFTATVTGTSNTAVTWAVSPGVGTISGSGLYTAPSFVGAQQTVMVTATSVADTSKSASATVTLTPIQVLQDLALHQPTAQSSTYAPGFSDASKAVDGNTDGKYPDGSLTHTGLDPNAWWQVDLGVSTMVGTIVIWNRTDCCGARLSDYWVFVSNTPFALTDTPTTLQNRAGTWSSHQTTAPNPSANIAVPGAQGRYVRVQLSGSNYLSMAEVQVFGVVDLAANKTATQSSTYAPGFTDASKAVDGNTDGVYADASLTHTSLDANAWWQVDLGASATVNSIIVWNRTDCCGSRLSDYWVFVSNAPFLPTDTPATLQNRAGTWGSHQTAPPNPSSTITVPGAQGRYVRVQLSGGGYLSLAEVQLFGQ